MSTLVTGGAGFIGSTLVDALVARGDDVIALDDLSTGRRENLDGALGAGAELVVGDVSDAAVVGRLVEDRRPRSVFHLAAQIDVRRAVADPVLDARTNVIGTINVLQAVREVGPANFVNISTGGAIYGERAELGVPVDERAPCFPETPYGQSKLSAEGYVALYARLHGIPGVSLRLANVYGPRQSPRAEAGVVAIFCGRLLAGEPPVVFGDGRQTRDYVYVGDAVEAMLAAERVVSESRGPLGPYNVGTGHEASVLELVELLGRLGGDGEWQPRMEPARPGEVQRIALDSTLAREELGWRPATELEPGLERTLATVRT